jgi:hypothetical protein
MFLIVCRQGLFPPAVSRTLPPCGIVGHDELLAPASLQCLALTVLLESIHFG